MRPMEVAQAVEDGRPAHSWLGDRLALDEKFSPQFNDDEVRELSELRKQIGADLQYRQSDIPDPSDFPDVATIVVSHRDLAALTNIGEREQAGEIPFMAIAPTSLHEARTLRSWLVEFEAFFTSVVSEEWLLACYRRLCGNKPFDAPKLAALKLAVEQWSALHVEGETLTLHSVLGLPSGEDAAFDRAASDLSAGRKPFGMFSVLKGGLKAKVEAVSLEGRKPQTADDWLVVVRTRQWDQAFSAFVARWNSLASAVECRPLPADFAAARAEFARIGRILSRLLVEVAGHAQRAKSIRSLFPYGIEPNAVLFEGGHGPLGLALAANLDKMELAAVEQMGKSTLDQLGIEPLGATAVPGTFTQHIEVPDPRGPADVAERPFGISANGSEPAEVPEPPTSDEQEEVVSVGDLVVIRYNDAPDRAIRIRLSDTENRPEVGIIHKAEPLGAALLGSAIDDEVEVKIGDLVRTAAIESIVKRPEL